MAHTTQDKTTHITTRKISDLELEAEVVAGAVIESHAHDVQRRVHLTLCAHVQHAHEGKAAQLESE